jgi:hypothetical protein
MVHSMSKILVIQPHKILQHAIALSLFPQHQARMTTSIPDLSAIKDVDAVIVDAASLQETHGLSAQAIHSLQSWNVPIIWIDSVDSSLTPSNENLVVVNTPIVKESLQSALDQCVGDSPRRARKGTGITSQEEPSSRKAVSSENIVTTVIDLVEVVEEAPKSQGRKGEQRQL